MNISKATATSGSKTVVLVDDQGKSFAFDCRPYIKGDWYGHLEDDLYFQKVEVDRMFNTLMWPEGQDVAPEDIDEYAVPIDGISGQVA